jgi:hypothetical protein
MNGTRCLNMASYADLSPYSYLPDTVPSGVTVLNVGWLDPATGFPRSEPSKEFTDALLDLCLHHPTARTRGWHACELDHGDTPPPYPLTVTAGTASHPLGSAEVRVISLAGVCLAAPDLIHHYVTAHGYAPPQQFVDAVMAGRTATES